MFYEVGESHYFEFVFDDSVELLGTIDCRYGEYPSGRLYPSVECTFNQGIIKMILHFR